MLWKKESTNKGAMYVELSKTPSFHIKQAKNLYFKHKMSGKCNDGGLYFKNEVNAKIFGKNGNEQFRKELFMDAMESYNKSLCFAENGSKSLGAAYANRAACFLKMNMFKKCLADIELAKENHYPADLMDRWEKMKNGYLKLMETEKDQSENRKLELDFSANEMFPCLANVVDIRSNDRDSLHLIATADIEVGKTVMVEQCFIGFIKNGRYASCNICLKENQNLIPCRKCTSAMFCSNCKENDLHRIECEIGSKNPDVHEFSIVLRSISLAKNAFKTADELIAFVEDSLKSSTLEVPSDLSDPLSKYRAFFKLCPDWRSEGLHLPVCLFQRLILDLGEMRAYFHTTAHRRFLMHLIQHHISMILRGSYNKRSAPDDSVIISSAYVNIVAKYINQSCTPNVCQVLQDGCIKFIVIRPIKKNEQLLI